MKFILDECAVLFYLHDITSWDSLTWPINNTRPDSGHRFKFSLQFSSVAQSCPALCDPMNCSMPGLLVHHQLLESTQTHVHCVHDAIQPSHPHPFSFCLQSSPASGSFQMNQLSASGGQSIRVSASTSVPPIPRLISFRMDWLDLLVIQGTLKSLLRHHSSKVLILRRSAFFTVQLSITLLPQHYY